MNTISGPRPIGLALIRVSESLVLTSSYFILLSSDGFFKILSVAWQIRAEAAGQKAEKLTRQSTGSSAKTALVVLRSLYNDDADAIHQSGESRCCRLQ